MDKVRGCYAPNLSMGSSGGSECPYELSGLVVSLRDGYWSLTGDETVADLMLGLLNWSLTEGYDGQVQRGALPAVRRGSNDSVRRLNGGRIIGCGRNLPLAYRAPFSCGTVTLASWYSLPEVHTARAMNRIHRAMSRMAFRCSHPAANLA